MAKNPSNLLDLDYAAQSKSFSRRFNLIDVHSHINGAEASKIYKKAAELYGIVLTYSMTAPEDIDAVSSVLGERIRFITIPKFFGGDPLHEHGPGYSQRIRELHARGARIAKFWSAPRICDQINVPYKDQPLRLNSPLRLEPMSVAAGLGMVIMVHVSDPDTWFATKYRDSERYGTKRAQYDALEDVMSRFDVPFIAAHMGGWPEDLGFLSSMLERHSKLYLDSSATKWVVRELSKHTREEFLSFLVRWKGRILFGSDIVTSDQHFIAAAGKNEMAAKASNTEEAFDLYASRYWALRTMYETNYRGQSPISDPDLAMVEPKKYSADAAPPLTGFNLPDDVLQSLYFDAAEKLLAPYYR